jgi:hypothetical protein
MEKSYSMKNIGIGSLVGSKVLSAKINEDHDLVILETQGKSFYLTWTGDCCAHCYLNHVTGVENLVGAEILSVESMDWNTLPTKDEYEVVESMGTKLKTTKGYVDFESRVEHNGYYGGEINVSDDEPMDQYSSPRNDWKQEKMSSLTDF